ncbi:MAG: hypothetical protein F4Y57_14420 [Acidobacteria bacterium]|nr:hypothetical protein [Acidobacteriota bacterium]
MATLGIVEEIYWYPVKSMLGESVRTAEFSGAGIAGDRVGAVRDAARGDFMTGKRVAALMGCTGRPAAEEGGVPEIELPTGDVFAADDPLASKRLSVFLGREVTLWPCDGAPAPSPPQGTPEETEAEWQVRMACPRCVMTTHGFADVPRDPTVMRRLVSEAGGDPGVYASVERGGRVSVGDAVVAID